MLQREGIPRPAYRRSPLDLWSLGLRAEVPRVGQPEDPEIVAERAGTISTGQWGGGKEESIAKPVLPPAIYKETPSPTAQTKLSHQRRSQGLAEKSPPREEGSLSPNPPPLASRDLQGDRGTTCSVGEAFTGVTASPDTASMFAIGGMRLRVRL
ncbi:hypothetical protein CSOJ01_10173 [Colletotrichum sojae]|uniref:Uncharacterized protein n=1 Tax=Colletotrichum sojae TaxID=2175907 RepID=A0A8H6J1L9_9PEZI|nr:hypothetical protein CSOJ01_10173 [Colletotrichum sojae]